MNALTTATLLAAIVITQLLSVGISLAFETPEHCPRGDNYENHNQIDYGPLRVSRIDGVATDPADAPVPSACVLLFTERSHQLVSKTGTDDRGEFRLAKIKNGRYRLVVSAGGFCSANVPIQVQAGSGAKSLKLHMRMGGIDTCSYGDVK
jgi:hypothetical protein